MEDVGRQRWETWEDRDGRCGKTEMGDVGRQRWETWKTEMGEMADMPPSHPLLQLKQCRRCAAISSKHLAFCRRLRSAADTAQEGGSRTHLVSSGAAKRDTFMIIVIRSMYTYYIREHFTAYQVSVTFIKFTSKQCVTRTNNKFTS